MSQDVTNADSSRSIYNNTAPKHYFVAVRHLAVPASFNGSLSTEPRHAKARQQRAARHGQPYGGGGGGRDETGARPSQDLLMHRMAGGSRNEAARAVRRALGHDRKEK